MFLYSIVQKNEKELIIHGMSLVILKIYYGFFVIRTRGGLALLANQDHSGRLHHFAESKRQITLSVVPLIKKK